MEILKTSLREDDNLAEFPEKITLFIVTE